MNYKNYFDIKKFSTKPVLFTNRHKISNIDETINNLPQFSSIIIREYDLDPPQREEFIKQILPSCRQKKIKTIIAKDLNMAQKYKSGGVHYSDKDHIPLRFFKKSSFKKNFIRSIACHSLRNIVKYSKYNVDYLFISPIYPTTSHNSSKTFGTTKLAKISLKCKKLAYNKPKLYALGGISKNNIKKIRKTKVSSFGAIDYFTK